MSKQAGNNATVRRPAKAPVVATKSAAVLDAEQAKAAEDKAKGIALIEAGNAIVNAKSNPAIAENKLGTNDAFNVYNDVDVEALTDAAVAAYREGERSSRREGQMQIANILARYHQDLLIGDSSPVNLYKNDKLQVGTVQSIARIIYCVPEKTMDGKKNPLPRNLEMRVRNIAPVIYYAVTERIPLVWSEKEDALLVPAWFATSDAAMVNVFQSNPEARTSFNKPVPLDGREGRNLSTILKRVPNPAKKPRPGATNQSNNDKQQTALKASIDNAGLARTLTIVADMFTTSPNKPFGDEVLELLAVCVEHVKTRNGSDAMGAAIQAVTGKAQKPKQAAA